MSNGIEVDSVEVACGIEVSLAGVEVDVVAVRRV